jgi:hypothetical protein
MLQLAVVAKFSLVANVFFLKSDQNLDLNDDLSKVTNVALHAINQERLFYQKTFFLLIKEIVVFIKAHKVLLQDFIKI